MKFKILQTENRDYSFMNYEWAKAHGFSLDDYEEVYNGEVEERDTIYQTLNMLFVTFNSSFRRPSDYKARSLSTSDIIVLDGKKFYCDNFGWKEVK